MKYNKNIDNIEPYVVSKGAELSDNKQQDWLKLDWNEATTQPNPEVIQDIKLFFERNKLFNYPDVLAIELKDQIAKYNNISSKDIELFNGSDSALNTIFSVFIDNSNVLLFEPTYTQVKPFINLHGGKIISSEIQNIFTSHDYNFEDIKKADIIYIVNPNNPTGNVISRKTILELANQYKNKLFIIDEAYCEFSDITVIKDVTKFENIIVTRTFSKAFALAGTRLGYIASNQNILNLINKVRNSKDINSIAQIAAISSLKNIEYIKNYCKEVKLAKQYFTEALKELQYQVADSESNFVLIKVNNSKKFVQFLNDNKILIRDRNSLINLNNCVRITIGNVAQMNRVINIIKDYKNE